MDKPAELILAENRDGLDFLKLFMACRNGIQTGTANGIKVLIPALIKVLQSTTLNKEALLQWLEKHCKLQWMIMSHGNKNTPETENGHSCNVMKNISRKWDLQSNYPTESKILYNQINTLFGDRKFRALRLAQEKLDAENHKVEKQRIRDEEEAEERDLQSSSSNEETEQRCRDNSKIDEKDLKKTKGKRSRSIEGSNASSSIKSTLPSTGDQHHQHSEKRTCIEKKTTDGTGSSASTTNTSSSSDTTIPLKQLSERKRDVLLYITSAELDKMIQNILSITSTHTEYPNTTSNLVNLISKTLLQIMDMKQSIMTLNVKTAVGTWNRNGNCIACTRQLTFPNFRCTCIDCIIEDSNQGEIAKLWYPVNTPLETYSSTSSTEGVPTNEVRGNAETLTSKQPSSNEPEVSHNLPEEKNEKEVHSDEDNTEKGPPSNDDQAEKEKNDELTKEALRLIRSAVTSAINPEFQGDKIKEEVLSYLNAKLDEHSDGKSEPNVMNCYNLLKLMANILHLLPTRSHELPGQLQNGWEAISRWHKNLVLDLGKTSKQRQQAFIENALEALKKINWVLPIRVPLRR